MINILSLFDGMSCGQQALNRIGFSYDNYYASEIDKYAITITQKNYPKTIQLGSVVNLKGSDFKDIMLIMGGSPCQSFSFAGKQKGMTTKNEQKILELEQYLKLKSEGFEFEGESYLFWEFVRLLVEIKPKYFLLENVMMDEEWEWVITKTLGVHPIAINSSLLSGQNRKRLYWTNIGMASSGLFGDMESIIEQPKDKGILLKDILETDVNEKYFLSDKMLNYLNTRKANFNNGKINYKTENDKASCINKSSSSLDLSDNIIIDNNAQSGCINNKGNLTEIKKAMCLDVNYHKGMDNPGQRTVIACNRKIIQYEIPEMVSVRKYEVDAPSLQKCLKSHKKMKLSDIADKLNISKTTVEHWFRTDNYFSIPTPEIWPSLKTLLGIKTDEFDKSIMEFEERDGVFEKSNRAYHENGLAPTLTATDSDIRVIINNDEVLSGTFRTHKDGEGFREVKSGKAATIPARAREDGSGQNVAMIGKKIRRLTPIECERLQTVSDNYTEGVSDTQRYRMLGNGWTVDVIAHILKYMK